MVSSRRVLAFIPALALIFSIGVVAAQKKDDAKKVDDKKQDETQKKETQGVIKHVDDVAAGQPAPNDLGLAWAQEHYLKAQGEKEYVPFTVTFDQSKVTAQTLTLYWRVVSKATADASAPVATGKKDDKKDDKKKGKVEYPYEDVSFVPTTGLSGRLSRSLTVPAGAYDVYVALAEPTSQTKGAPPQKVSIVKQSITVPDFWNGDLNTSSVIVAQRIDPLSTPLTPQEQVDRPYALGPMEIVPATDLKFPKKSDLSTFMLIYNPKTTNGKPDVTVEYSFYAKSGGTEKFFNKTNPQNLNAQTLPPQFDLAAGHQLQSGQAVPLASFPEGDYRLEIKVTDKLANKSLTRDVNFSVTAS